ncbi:hypothetical protein CC78DRAFT_586744 [Lojkania enalia]|uniref:Uncharacterized protein n=1 Tax=Lojkania enalia TaxID=147567 RepID=A0A9P4K218_9PLEO|nr:hypothetical protein CC78DRAFT_586744 [Didymosphaeria enalia]
MPLVCGEVLFCGIVDALIAEIAIIGIFFISALIPRTSRSHAATQPIPSSRETLDDTQLVAGAMGRRDSKNTPRPRSRHVTTPLSQAAADPEHRENFPTAQRSHKVGRSKTPDDDSRYGTVSPPSPFDCNNQLIVCRDDGLFPAKKE